MFHVPLLKKSSKRYLNNQQGSLSKYGMTMVQSANRTASLNATCSDPSSPYCVCLPCEAGKTFNANPNNSTSCQTCSPKPTSCTKTGEIPMDCTVSQDAGCYPCSGTCPAGQYVTGCPDGKVSCGDCPAGTYSTTNDLSMSCVPCPAGTASNTKGLTTVCPGCVKGKTYQSQTGQQTCNTCTAGTLTQCPKSSCTTTSDAVWDNCPTPYTHNTKNYVCDSGTYLCDWTTGATCTSPSS